MKKFSFVFILAFLILSMNRASAQHPIVGVIDSCKTVIGAATVGTTAEQYARSQVNIANKLIAGAEAIVATGNQAKIEYALRDLRNGIKLYFVPNSQLPIKVTSYFDDFNGIVDTAFVTVNAGGATSATGIMATVENDALKFNCLGYSNAWFSQVFGISFKQLNFNLNDYRYVSFKAKADRGATWNGEASDSTRIGFNTGSGEYLNHKIPTDGNWHNLTFALPANIDFSGVWRVLFTPGLSFNDGAVGNEFVGTVWIDDFKAGKAALPEIFSVIDSCKAVVVAAVVGTAANQYVQSQVNIANKLISGAKAIVATGNQAKIAYALRDLKNGMKLYFVPNSQLPIKVTSYFDDFNGIVDTAFVTVNAGGATSATGIMATVENDALKFNCLGYNNAWFSQIFGISFKQLNLNINDKKFVSFRAKAELGATWNNEEQDSTRIGFNTGNDHDYLNHKIPTDGKWHTVAFQLPSNLDYSGIWRMLITPGLSFADGAVGNEFVGTVWIDDFKAGGAFVMPENANLVTLIDSSKAAVNATVIGDLPGQYSKQSVDAANITIAKAEAAKTLLTQELVDKAETELRASMKLFKPNSVTAVSKMNGTELKMYPNPVKDVLTITNVARNSSLGIYSLTGQLIMKVNVIQEGNALINLHNLHSGVYFARVTSDQGTLTGKFIKE